MPWTRFDDAMGEHRKVRRALVAGGVGTFGLHAMGLLHASRYLTDGYVEQEFVTETFALAHTKRNECARVLQALEQNGLWLPTGDGGWTIHDYLDHNPSRAEIEEKRRRDAERKASGRRVDSKRSPRGQASESARPTPTPTPIPSSSSPTAARERAIRVMTVFADAESPIGEESVERAAERFPALDLVAEAHGCAEYLRANPGRDAGLTFMRWLERAKAPDAKATTSKRGQALRELTRRTD
jgi:hypothetical protein